MGRIAENFASAFRDFETIGVPASGEHEPVKSDIRALGPEIEAAIGAVAIGGLATVTKATRTALNADLAHAEGTYAIVFADPTIANNDFYVKSGASGAGAWTNTGFLGASINAVAVDVVQPLVEAAEGHAEDAAVSESNAFAHRNAAEGFAEDSEAASLVAIAARDDATAASDLVILAAAAVGNPYADAATGIAGTDPGDGFYTFDGTLYENVAGVAVPRAIMLTASRSALVTAQLYGAVADEETDDSAAFVTANNQQKTVAITRQHYIAADVTLDRIDVGPFGRLKIAAGVTVTIGEIVDTPKPRRIFDVSEGGEVVILQRTARPEWWGDVEGNIMLAGAALYNGGGNIGIAGQVMLDPGGVYPNQGHVYSPGSTADAVYWSFDNISIIGGKKPDLNDDCTALENGTIIQGMFLVFANNLVVEKVGCDSGKTYVDLNNGGVASEGLLFTFPSQEAKDDDEQRSNVTAADIIGLAKDPSSPVHAVILGEGYKDFHMHGEIIGCMGMHAIAVKGRDFTSTGSMVGYCGGVESVIFKTDAQLSAVCQNGYIAYAAGYAGHPSRTPHTVSTTGVSLMINPSSGNVSLLRFGEIYTVGHPYGLRTVFGQFGPDGATPAQHVIDGLMVDKITCTRHSVACISFEGFTGSANKILRSSFGMAQFRNSPVGISATMEAECEVPFGSIKSALCGVALDSGAWPTIVCPSINADGNTSGVVRIRGNSKPLLGLMTRTAMSGVPVFATDSGAVAWTFAPDWSNFGGTDEPEFGVYYVNGEIRLKGLVKYTGAATNTIGTLPPCWRPVKNERRSVQVVNSGTPATLSLGIYVDGTVAINIHQATMDPASGANAYLCLDVGFEIAA